MRGQGPGRGRRKRMTQGFKRFENLLICVSSLYNCIVIYWLFHIYVYVGLLYVCGKWVCRYAGIYVRMYASKVDRPYDTIRYDIYKKVKVAHTRLPSVGFRS